MARPSVRRVAVIGAGAAGLTAVKACLEEGLEPTCFEKTETVGGLWCYTEEPKDLQASIYSNTISNGSKIFLNFSDLPMPDAWPMLLPHQLVRQYLENYADHFKLLPHIRFKHETLNVSKAKDFHKSGRWVVHVKSEDGTEEDLEFDAVMVCAGLHKQKTVPEYDGVEGFEGEIFHTQQYPGHDHFKDKKVVIVGFGDSAVDAALEISRMNPHKVHLSTRNGNWVIPRTANNGLPYDLMLNRRSTNYRWSWWSMDRLASYFESFCNLWLDHDLFNIRPPWRFTNSQPLINSELANCVPSGKIEICRDIKRVCGRRVEFVDGHVVEAVDAIIFGTGYKPSYPFLDPSLRILSRDDSLNLYKWVFPPDLAATFAMIGCVRVIGGHFPTFELQARWATRVFKGLSFLPKPAKMQAMVTAQQKAQDTNFLSNTRHRVTLFWMPYNDDIAGEIGVKPNIATLLLREPGLAWRVWTGHCVPSQYRLMGPGSWSGASDVIVTYYAGPTLTWNSKGSLYCSKLELSTQDYIDVIETCIMH